MARRSFRPPPIITKNDSIGVHHMMILIEAWNWIKTIQHQRDVEYVRIFPERLDCYGQLGVMSVIVKEHPEGLYILSNLDYFYYCCSIDTIARRPSPLEYYRALCYFRRRGAATEDIVNLDYSDSDADEYEMKL